MAHSAQPFFKINLLIHKGEQIKIYVRLLHWILSSGKFIVVFVELLVIGAFVLRYMLDAQLSELQEKIKDQVPYLESLQRDEASIRQTQFQLSTIKQTRQTDPDYSQFLMKMAQLTPQKITLSSIRFDNTQTFSKISFSLTGSSPSNIELSAYIKVLKKDPQFSDITLTNISFEGQTNFTITGNLTHQSGRKS